MRTPPHVILLLGAAMLWGAHARAAGFAGKDKDACRVQAQAQVVLAAAQAAARAGRDGVEAGPEARADKLVRQTI